MGRVVIIITFLFLLLFSVCLVLIQDRNINYKKKKKIISFMIWLTYSFILFYCIRFLMGVISYVS